MMARCIDGYWISMIEFSFNRSSNREDPINLMCNDRNEYWSMLRSNTMATWLLSSFLAISLPHFSGTCTTFDCDGQTLIQLNLSFCTTVAMVSLTKDVQPENHWDRNRTFQAQIQLWISSGHLRHLLTSILNHHLCHQNHAHSVGSWMAGYRQRWKNRDRGLEAKPQHFEYANYTFAILLFVEWVIPVIQCIQSNNAITNWRRWNTQNLPK